MDRKIATDIIRQVLTSELGLSRDYIREQCEEIIQSVIETHIKRLVANGQLGRLIVSAINEDIRRNRDPYNERIVDIVRNAAVEVVKEWVETNITITHR